MPKWAVGRGPTYSITPVVSSVVDPDEDPLELDPLEPEPELDDEPLLPLESLEPEPVDVPVEPVELELEDSESDVVVELDPVGPVDVEVSEPDRVEPSEVSRGSVLLELVSVVVDVDVDVDVAEIPVDVPEDVVAMQSPMHSIDAIPHPGAATTPKTRIHRFMGCSGARRRRR